MTALRLVLPPQSLLEVALTAAVEEGLAPNVRRWFAIHGHVAGEPMEMQAINVAKGGSSYTESRFAHAFDVETCIRLLEQTDTWEVPAIYLIANEVDPAVATRAEPGRWHPMQKGESTSDAEIRSRRVLYIDIDAKRAKGTSATDEEVARTHAVAVLIHAKLGAILFGDSPLALGASGNGRAVMVALGSIPSTPEVHATVKGILSALGALYATPEVIIDASVCDPKRLLPAWGTMKRKGARGVSARPHRRTGLVCRETPARVDLAGLESILAALRAEITPEQSAVVDKAMGKRPAPTPPPQPRPGAAPFHGEKLYDRANDQPIQDVVSRCGFLEGDDPKCAGCGTVGDSSVAFVGNGVKCLHARCSGRGKDGFYTAVDFVAAAMNLQPVEAVNQIAEWFGFDGFKPRAEPRHRPPAAEPPEGWVDPEAEEAAESAPPPREKTPAQKAEAKSAVERYGVLSVGNILLGVLNRAQAPTPEKGAISGHAAIDKLIGAFRRERITVVGAATSWGKSSFAVMTSDESIRIGKTVLLISGEDGEDTYGQRLMSRRARVNSMRLRDGIATEEEIGQMTAEVALAERVPFFLSGIGKTAEFLAAAIKDIAAEVPIDLVIIDYLQAFTCAKRCQDRRNEITHIARLFADAIKASKAAGLVFSQIRRLEDGERPTMHHLKESGDVENMAEHVLMGFQTKRADPSNPGNEEIERFMVIEKNKDGPKMPIPLKMDFNEHTASFDAMDIRACSAAQQAQMQRRAEAPPTRRRSHEH